MNFYKLLPITFFFMISLFASCKPNDADLLRTIQFRVNDLPIGVTFTVDNQTVLMEGIVDSERMRNELEKEVSNTQGVKSVINHLEVIPSINKESRSMDSKMQSQIASVLQSEGFVDMEVDVSQGLVQVSGEISKSDYAQVEQIVRTFANGEIIDDIRIKD